MFCSNCGQQNPEGAKFCGGCGQQMPVAAPPVQPPPQAQPVQAAPVPPAPPVAPAPAQPVPPNYQQPAMAPGQMPYVPSHMGLAIFVLIVCCQVFGIVAVIQASKVKGRLAAGDLAGAQAASASAKKWAIIGLIGGAIIYALFAVSQMTNP